MRNIRIRLLLVWISIALVAFFYAWHLVRHMPLSLVRWRQSPTLIAVQSETRKGEPGLLLVRLKDGKEQFVAGSWDIRFAPSGNSFVYPTFLGTTTSTTSQTLYAVEGANKISVITMADAKGSIVSVEENPARTYLFVGMRDGATSSYCIVRKLPEDGKPECKEIRMKEPVVTGLWNPNVERELILQTASGDLYAHDPWEKEPKKIDPATDAGRYPELKALFAPRDEAKNAIVYDGVRHSFWKIGSALLVRGSSWSLHRVPFFSTVSWLPDADHFLIKESGSLSIFERSTGQQALLLLEPGVGNKEVTTR